MCQNVFFTYACSHVECVTFRCLKSTNTAGSYCIHRQEPQHTTLKDQLCHDCTELSRHMRQMRGRRERCQQQQTQTQAQSRPQSQLSMYEQQSSQTQMQTQHVQQPQTGRDQQSSSPDSKPIRPLESSKLANMDCGLEGSFGLAPSEVYRYYTSRGIH
ncbi:hypothetical protein EsH8_IV_001085 [Colletotrichum jinshuiense]